jgi:hypothetical protein
MRKTWMAWRRGGNCRRPKSHRIESREHEEIVLLDLIWDEMEFPIVVLRSELPLPETVLLDGALHVIQEEVLNNILGELKPMCAECLKAHLGN